MSKFEMKKMSRLRASLRRAWACGRHTWKNYDVFIHDEDWSMAADRAKRTVLDITGIEPDDEIAPTIQVAGVLAFAAGFDSMTGWHPDFARLTVEEVERLEDEQIERAPDA